MNPGLSSTLDALRWMAALMVVVSHVHHIILVNFSDIAQKNALWKMTYFFGSFGREAVVIFFVVSGFLVGGITLRRWHQLNVDGKPPEMLKYWTQRFARIYIVLIPALLLGCGFDLLGSTFFDHSAIYADSARFHTISLNSPIVENIGVGVFLGNLAMLQNIAVSVLGSNGPLWSLAYEWWYYCLFAITLGFYYYKGLARFVCLALVGLMLYLLPFKIILWMLIWLLGVAAYVYCRSSLPKVHPSLGLLTMLAALVVNRFSHSAAGGDDGGSSILLPFLQEFSLGAACAFALTSFSRLRKPILLAAVHGRLAAFSYSIYLTHFPVMVLVIAISHDWLGVQFVRQPSLVSYIYLVIVILMIYIFGLAFYKLTESHTVAVASVLRARLASGLYRRLA